MDVTVIFFQAKTGPMVCHGGRVRTVWIMLRLEISKLLKTSVVKASCWLASMVCTMQFMPL